jgi:hypothetical protein
MARMAGDVEVSRSWAAAAPNPTGGGGAEREGLVGVGGVAWPRGVGGRYGGGREALT